MSLLAENSRILKQQDEVILLGALDHDLAVRLVVE